MPATRPNSFHATENEAIGPSASRSTRGALWRRISLADGVSTGSGGCARGSSKDAIIPSGPRVASVGASRSGAVHGALATVSAGEPRPNRSGAPAFHPHLLVRRHIWRLGDLDGVPVQLEPGCASGAVQDSLSV